jgi:hypothetical protein
MCDYSLCGLPNRLAKEGESLEVHKFSTGSMGLASPLELHSKPQETVPEKGFWHTMKNLFQSRFQPETAVCIPPGADLILKGIPPHLQERFGVEDIEGVKFVQTSAVANTHRDAIQFENGRIAGLQDLPEGLQVEILSLARVYAEDLEEDSFHAPMAARLNLR